MQIKNALVLTIIPVIGLLLLGCQSCPERPITDSRTVHVIVSGEVRNCGEREIGTDFSLECFLSAVGGFTFGSDLGATPTRFNLERVEGGRKKEWRIRFDEMPRYEAKGFTFQDGDIIVVPKLVF